MLHDFVEPYLIVWRDAPMRYFLLALPFFFSFGLLFIFSFIKLVNKFAEGHPGTALDRRRERHIMILLSIWVMRLGAVAGFAYCGCTAQFLLKGARADGQIIGGESRESRDAHGFKTTSIKPVVRFLLPSGRQVIFTSSIGFSGFQPFREPEVAVIYNPNDPSEARINSFWTLWFPNIMALLGAAFAAFVGWSPASGFRRHSQASKPETSEN